MNKNETSEDVRRWFLTRSGICGRLRWVLFPCAESPCIRENCSVCASGKGHSSYALSGYRGNRRFSVYVPDELAPEIQRAVEKGRQLQDLIKEGVRYFVPESGRGVPNRRSERCWTQRCVSSGGDPVLGQDDLLAWFQRLSIPEPTRSMINHIRSSGPSAAWAVAARTLAVAIRVGRWA